MKRLLLTLITALLMSSTTWAQEEIFKKFADHEGVTTMYISKKMLNMINDYGKKKGNININNIRINNFLGRISSLQCLSCEDEDTIDEIRKEIAYIKDDDDYELLMSIKEDDEQLSIYTKEGKKENQYILLSDTPDEFNFLLLKGEITREELQDALKPLTYSP